MGAPEVVLVRLRYYYYFLLLTRTCKGRAICFKIRSWSTILDADLHLNVISLPIRKKKTKQNKLHSKMKRKQNRNCIKSRKMQINCLPHSLFYKAEYLDLYDRRVCPAFKGERLVPFTAQVMLPNIECVSGYIYGETEILSFDLKSFVNIEG